MSGSGLTLAASTLLLASVYAGHAFGSDRPVPEGQHSLQPWMKTAPESWENLGRLITAANAVNAAMSAYNEHQQAEYQRQQQAYTHYINSRLSTNRRRRGDTGQEAQGAPKPVRRKESNRNNAGADYMKSYKPPQGGGSLIFVPIGRQGRHKCIAC